jgi:diguanylate cyclase (GGDEF)-like protein
MHQHEDDQLVSYEARSGGERVSPKGQALVEARLLEALRLGSSCTTVFLDADYVVLFCSDSMHALLGHQSADLIGADAISMVHPDDLASLAGMMAAEEASPTTFAAAGHGRLALRPIRLRTADGSWRALDVAIGNYQPDSNVNGYILQFVDAEIRTAELNAYRSLVEVSDPVEALNAIAVAISVRLEGASVMIEADGVTNRMSPAQMKEFQLLDLDRADVLTVPVRLEHEVVGRVVAIDGTGRPFTYWSNEVLGTSTQLVTKLVERQRATLALARAANTDALTGLANRHAFEAELRARKLRPARDHVVSAVLYIDLDGFKQVNDRYGHLAGDQVLVVVGERLSEIVRGADVVARIGGDEFCVLATVANPEAARLLGERIEATMLRPITIDGITLSVGATVGIAVSSDELVSGLIRAADDLVVQLKGQPKQHRQGSVALTVVD